MASTNTQNNVVTLAAPAIVQRVPFMEQLERDLEFSDHWQYLINKGKEHLAKTEGKKKGPFDRIITREKDAQKFTIPTLINIRPGFNFRDLNSRYGQEGIIELAKQIAADGVRKAIKVFTEGNDPTNYAEDGHRRMAALKYGVIHLGSMIEEVPVYKSAAHANDRERVFSQYADNTGLPPTPFETASLFARLIGLGMTESDIARRTGKGVSRVSSLLDMAAVPSALQMLPQNEDIKISDTFIHTLWKANGKDADKTMNDLTSAIEEAKRKDADRVMPKHLEPAVRRAYDNFLRPATRILPVIPTPPTPEVEEAEEQEAADIEAVDEGAPEELASDPAPDDTDGTPKDLTAALSPMVAKPSAPSSAKPAASTPVPQGNVTTLRTGRSTPVIPAPKPAPSVHTVKPDNYTVRSAAMEFFKLNVQFMPMEEGAEFQEIRMVDNKVPLELALALRHGYNLDDE